MIEQFEMKIKIQKVKDNNNNNNNNNDNNNTNNNWFLASSWTDANRGGREYENETDQQDY